MSELVFDRFLPTTLSILSGIPKNQPVDSDESKLPEYFDSEPAGDSTTKCTQQCLFQITPLTLDAHTYKFAIFAFPDSLQTQKFTVTNPSTGGVEELCKCAIIQYVQQLNFPGWRMYFTLPEDRRAQFIVVPKMSDIRLFEKKYPNQVVVSGAQLFQLGNLDKKKMAQVELRQLFAEIVVEDTPAVNTALTLIHKSTEEKDKHNCSNPSRGNVVFTVGGPKIPDVPNANPTTVNKRGKEQFGNKWKPVIEPRVYRTRQTVHGRKPQKP